MSVYSSKILTNMLPYLVVFRWIISMDELKENSKDELKRWFSELFKTGLFYQIWLIDQAIKI